MPPKTLKDACAAFVEHLRETGTPDNSLSSYAWNLRLLINHLGEEKEVGKILTVHIATFFKSEAATTKVTKTGEQVPRTAGSISQLRRVTGWALVWFQTQGWIDRVPLPAEDRARLEAQKAASGEEGEEKPARRNRKAKSTTETEGGLKASSADSDQVYSEPDGHSAPQAIAEPDTASGAGSNAHGPQNENVGPTWLLL